MQPGETITPGSTEPPRDPNQQPIQPPASAPAPELAPISGDTPDAPWRFTANQSAGDTPAAPVPQPVPAGEAVTWSTSEYIAHHKGFSWFLLLAMGTAAAAALVFLITNELVSAIVVGVVGLSFGIFATRKPQVLTYTVDNTGLHIGSRFYSYHLFRSFSVLDEGPVRSILFMPTKRFDLPITIYYDPDDEAKIIDVIGAYLPHETREVPPIDRFMSRIRF